jgi:hypothetical protein
MPIIPALVRLRQEDHEFPASQRLHCKTLSQKPKHCFEGLICKDLAQCLEHSMLNRA